MLPVCAVFVLVLALVLPAAPRADVPDVLRISAIPDENPNELIRIYTPFAEYLQKELGMKVQFTPVVDYAATVEGLAARKLDLVWYGGFTSVQAVRRTNGTPKRPVVRHEEAQVHAGFLGQAGSGNKKLPDVQGHDLPLVLP